MRKPIETPPPKKAKKKGAPVTVTSSVTVLSSEESATAIRHRLMAAYMQDANERGIESVYETTLDEDGKPLFPKHISVHTARRWALEGRWPALREEVLADLEIRTFEMLKDEILKQRLKETRDLWEIREMLVSHLGPKRDKNGSIRMHPLGSELEGLPMLNYEPKGGYTKLLEAFLKLDERIQSRRNETLPHLSSTLDDAKGIDPNAQTIVQEDSPEKDLVRRLAYTPDAMRKMAHTLLRRGMDSEEGADVEEDGTIDSE